MACEAFERYVLGGKVFSSNEIDAMKAMLSGKPCPLSGREKELFDEKLK
jgi:hypothetical protein